MKLFGIDVGHGNSLKDKLYWLVNGFMTNMGFVLWGGSPPPASAPTSTTVMNTNIPDYAQPYVTNMLNAAQAQIYNPSGTGFNPYTPYSTNPANYVAGFSPLQQQAQSSAANLQTPYQYQQAMGQTMGATRQLGNVGQQMGMAGMNYANQATNPAAIQAYMNPYIQASLAPQLALANQQYGMAGQQEQSAATGAGAFGGSREALMNSLNAQNQMLAQNQLIGQGYNNAFNAAQQAQQYGAQLGLSGQQAQAQALASQMAGANQLAGLGGQQLAAQQSILGTQAQQGAAEQTQQQNIINQAVQNYATAQQYPYMQLGVLNSMLRGLPMQQSSTQMYQAPPSAISQAAGLGTAALGLGSLANTTGMFKADGGVVKAKKGGVLKAAGGIPLSMMNKQELESPYLSPIEKIQAPFVQSQQNDLRQNPSAAQIISSVNPATSLNPMMQQQRAGVASIATPPNLTTMKAAGGGLLAFAEGDVTPEVEEPKEENKEDTIPSMLVSERKRDDNIPSMLVSDRTAEPTSLADVTPAPVASAPVTKDLSASYNPSLNQDVTDFFLPSSKPTDLSSIGNAPAAAPAIDEDMPAEYRKFVDPKTNDFDLHKYTMYTLTHPDKESQKASQKSIDAYNESIAERNKNATGMALLRSGLGIMAGTSPFALANIGAGAPAGLNYMEQIQQQNEKDKAAVAELTLQAAKSDDQRRTQLINNAIKYDYLAKAAEAKENKISDIERDTNRLEYLKKNDPKNPVIKRLEDSLNKRTLLKDQIIITPPASNETVDFYAHQALRGDYSWATGLSRSEEGKKLRNQVQARLPSLAKENGMDWSDASAAKGETKALTSALTDRTKYLAASDMFMHNFDKQADLVSKYMSDGVAGRSPVFNRWIQAGRKQIAGDPQVNELDTAIRSLAREHQRISTGVTSNAQLQAGAQRTGDSLLNINMNEDQLKGVLRVMREEAHNLNDSGRGEVADLKAQLKNVGKGYKTEETEASPSKSESKAPASIPAIPEGIPSNAKYSASKNEFWWQDDKGNWQHKKAK